MLDKLKSLNPDIEFYSVYDPEFSVFGRIITDFDATEIIETAKKIPNPESGSTYRASEPTFEDLKSVKEIEKLFFGELPAQAGYCWGHNTKMNATEWHFCSEINIAVTPIVLILGNVWDIKDGVIDSSKFKAFYVPQGVTVEVYSTSLHFCPCQVSDSGFGSYVGLAKGTNTPLEDNHSEKYIFAKNKWLISHVDNDALIARGAFAGITGKNFEIKYK